MRRAPLVMLLLAACTSSELGEAGPPPEPAPAGATASPRRPADPPPEPAETPDHHVAAAPATAALTPPPVPGPSSDPKCAGAAELQLAADAAMHADDPAAARKHWLVVVRDFPSCPQVPYAYLAFAEHFFALGELASAKQAYEKVAQFNDPELRSFAIYKLAWCELNLADPLAALGHFVAVVRAAGRDPSPSQQRLRDAALRDSVNAYVEAGDPNKARDFYRSVAGTQATAMLARLAQRYRDRGDAAAATLVCADAGAAACSPEQVRP